MRYANEYAPRDGVLRLHLIAHGPAVKKADAYLIALDGEYYLIDGGMTDDTTSYEYLIRLRAALLDRAPAEDAHAPLRLHWVVSHFHQDHVAATMQYILRDRRVAVDRVYLPPRTALDPKYPDNGDTKYRDKCLDLLARHQPEAEIITSTFGGDPLTLPFGDDGRSGGTVTLYPPDRDWGVGEAFRYIVDNYYDGDETRPNTAVAVVNACSQWMQIRWGGRSCLFTGDTMKRKAKLDGEAFETMLARWGAAIGEVDIAKWLHHGYVRDNAAARMLSLRPRRIIVSHPDATAPVAAREFVAAHGGVMPEFINCAERDVVIDISADGGVKVCYR